MSRIEELIEELCPEGVVFKKLGDVCENIISGKNKQRIETGEFPVYGSTGIIGHTDEYVFDEECLLIARVGANAGFVYRGKGKYDVSDNTLIVRPKAIYNLSFGYYQLYFFGINKLAKGGGQPLITAGDIKKIQIPIPPLPIQQEIVTILDTFTELDAELQAELEARRKQYEHYRNDLLNFERKEVEWKTLGEVAHYSKSRISASVVDERNYVGVENLLQNKQGKTLSNYVPIKGNLIEFKTNDILIGNIRPYLKKIWMATNNGGTNGDVLVIRINSIFNSSLIPKFLYFALSSDIFFDYDNQYAKGGKMPRGDKNAVLRYKIPIPPLAEQERIVGILDKFEALVTGELPAEIEGRRKQYEYYREKLLTFEPLTTNP